MYEYKMPQGTAFPNVSQKIRLPEAFLFYPFSIVPIPSSVVHPSYCLLMFLLATYIGNFRLFKTSIRKLSTTFQAYRHPACFTVEYEVPSDNDS